MSSLPSSSAHHTMPTDACMSHITSHTNTPAHARQKTAHIMHSTSPRPSPADRTFTDAYAPQQTMPDSLRSHQGCG
eukprot:276758-Rhodomonas_salina.2